MCKTPFDDGTKLSVSLPDDVYACANDDDDVGSASICTKMSTSCGAVVRITIGFPATTVSVKYAHAPCANVPDVFKCADGGGGGGGVVPDDPSTHVITRSNVDVAA